MTAKMRGTVPRGGRPFLDALDVVGVLSHVAAGVQDGHAA
jgi:hypothetical protein